MVGKKKNGTKLVRKTSQGHVMEGLLGQGKGIGLCSKCDEKLEVVSAAAWGMG